MPRARGGKGEGEKNVEKKAQQVNVSRKEFFRKSLFSLGEMVGTAAGLLKQEPAVAAGEEDAQDFIPQQREDLVAVAKEYCLAKNSGCFACLERCETGAVKLVMGQGIRVDEALCTGCGACNHVCPVSPKAVALVARQ